MNIDTLFSLIMSQELEKVQALVSANDIKILTSLNKSINSHLYITEKQSSLLLKVLKENLNHFTQFDENFEFYVNSPVWSKPFRYIDQTKRMYIQTESNPFRIYYEFPVSGQLKQVFSILNVVLSGFVCHHSGKLYSADLTENNIVASIDALSKHNFELDESLKSYYKTITSWNRDDYKNQFTISTMPTPDFQKIIAQDLGIDTPLTQNLINDRSIRYQYFTEKLKSPETLTEIIANRTDTSLWIDKTQFALKDIIHSLIELKRLPVLIVFDVWESARCSLELKNLIAALDANNITDNIGIYFRVSNDHGKSEFNQLIADNNYNGMLNDHTKVVGVQNGKIPKFFLNSSWTPMSIISLGSSFKNNKTDVYSNCCDLVITHSPNRPLIESKVLWELN